VLRCSKELQQWNPRGGYCGTIPCRYNEQRELKPDEDRQAADGIGGAGAGAAVTGHVRPMRKCVLCQEVTRAELQRHCGSARR
jgi:hypothetical protein